MALVSGCIAAGFVLLYALSPTGSDIAPAGSVLAIAAVVATAASVGVARLVGASDLRTHQSAVIIAAFLSIGIGIRAGLDLNTSTPLSQSLIRPAPELGPGGKALLPNLVNAESVVPDRPHHPDDVNAADRFDRFSRLRRFTASTNRLGMRGPDVSMPSPGFRVLCIGDSVTFGWGVADDQTYPAHLSRELGVEVLNAGMPASKPAHMAKWLQLNAQALDVDLVVMAARPHWAAPQPFEEYARSIQAAESAIRPARLAIVLPPVSTFDPMGVRDRHKEVAGLQRVLNGRPFLELTPLFWAAQSAPGVIMESDGGTQRMVRLPNRELVAEGPSRGDQLALELIDAFESDHTLIEPLFFDGGHPDERGNALFAKEVARFLKQQQLVPHVRKGAVPQSPQ